MLGGIEFPIIWPGSIESRIHGLSVGVIRLYQKRICTLAGAYFTLGEMNFATALDLAASFFGLASGLFFAVGVLHVKDTTLQTIATSMWGKGLTIATELAQQKSDFIFGALLLIFSFFVQVVAKFLPREIASLAVAPSKLSGVALSFGVPAIVLCVLYIPWRLHRKKSVRQLIQSTQGQL